MVGKTRPQRGERQTSGALDPTTARGWGVAQRLSSGPPVVDNDVGSRQVLSNNYSEWEREWGDGTEDGLQYAGFHLALSIHRSKLQWKLLAVSSNFIPVAGWCAVLYDRWSRERETSSVNMGSDPITTEPIVLKIVDSWKDGKVIVNGIEFSINKMLIVEVFGLSNEGEVITRDKTNQVVKTRKGKAPLHQGLMKLLVDFEKDRRGAIAGPHKGGFSRLSGTPVSKAQLLLGLAPPSPLSKSRDTALDSEDDSLSQDGDSPVPAPKDGGSKKRKPPSQVLNANLAKCVGSNPIEKGPAKGLDGTQTLTKELRCHLKVLNGLGGSLSSTYACINLLTLEITYYLKEVVKNMMDLSAAKEQQNPAGK
eukprot:Gb_30590 [translate_table: standard]